MARKQEKTQTCFARNDTTRRNIYPACHAFQKPMVPIMGVEPITSALLRQCAYHSTIRVNGTCHPFLWPGIRASSQSILPITIFDIVAFYLLFVNAL